MLFRSVSQSRYIAVVGMPSIDENSSDLDIQLRFYGLVGMFVLLLGYIFLTFNPELMNS